jgi:hypothetical protein
MTALFSPRRKLADTRGSHQDISHIFKPALQPTFLVILSFLKAKDWTGQLFPSPNYCHPELTSISPASGSLDPAYSFAVAVLGKYFQLE